MTGQSNNLQCRQPVSQLLLTVFNSKNLICRSFYQTAELNDVSPIALNTGRYDTDSKVYIYLQYCINRHE